jgi:protocatechuate 3,4-dioxygenase beta subunit
MMLFSCFRASRDERKQRKAFARPGVETLETRWLPSGNSISGFVFVDANNNGLYDSGEMPLGNVAVRLLNSSNIQVGSTVTDGTGAYSFSTDSTINTSPTTLTENASVALTSTNWQQTLTIPQFNPNLGTLTSIQIVSAGVFNSDIKVENTDNAPATVTGTDAGTLTLTGPGISGLVTSMSTGETVTLQAYDGKGIDFDPPCGVDFGAQSAPGSKSLTISAASLSQYIGTGSVTLTDAASAACTATGAGNLVAEFSTQASAQVSVIYTYTPSNALKPGNYTIVETPPAGYLDGLVSSNGVVIPRSVGTHTIAVTLANANVPNNNFAHLAPASVSGYAYIDANNNGNKESGETVLPSVNVALTGTNDLGPVSLTTTTLADGSYQFGNLRPGSYTITESPPAMYNGFSLLPGLLSSNGTVIANSVGSHSIAVAIANAGVATNVPNNNFAHLEATSLGGFVYVDNNNSGIKQAGDPVIANVSLTLTGANDLGSIMPQTTQTLGDGSYSFANLRPGTYTITVTQPSGYFAGKQTLGSAGGSQGNNQFTAIALGSGASATNYNFGELQPVSIAGFVYIDLNDNGVWSTNKPGVGGTTIILSGTNELGGPVNQSTTTASDGSYSFAGLVPGTYTLTETPPAGYLQGKDSIGSAGGTVGNAQFLAVNLNLGVAAVNYNFGELTPGSLSGYVWIDGNDNGGKDPGEGGVPNVTVTLTGTNDLGQSINTAQATGADGSYSFGNLRPGTYTISENTPSGYFEGKESLGSAGGTATDPAFNGIALGVGVAGNNYDFGVLLPSSLAGWVYVDNNNNGIKDPGEAGIGGVTVTLTGTDDNGTPVNQAQTSAADGSFQFASLRPGTYTLTEAAPGNYIQGRDSVGSIGGMTTTDQFSAIHVSMGAAGVNYNFGHLVPSSLSGFVYLDSNNDGIMEPNESGIANVTVAMSGTTDQGTNLSVLQQTGPDGSFNFIGLRPGTYTITKTPPGSYLDGKLALGSLGGNAGNNQFTGIALLGGQAGTNYNFGELLSPKSTGKTYADSFTPNSSNFLPLPALSVLSKLQFLSSSGSGQVDPTIVAQATWLNGVYNTLLTRPADDAGLLNWLTAIHNGMSLSQVVTAIWNSAEHRVVEVKQLYQTFLGRSPDPGGQLAWVNALLAGMTESQMAAILLTSGEYTATHPDNQSYVLGLYDEVLGRTPGDQEVANWVQALQNGVSRAAAANAFLTSGESYLRIIGDDYASYLGRSVDPAGQQAWLALLVTGQITPGQLSVILLSSAEYYDDAVLASRS